MIYGLAGHCVYCLLPEIVLGRVGESGLPQMVVVNVSVVVAMGLH